MVELKSVLDNPRIDIKRAAQPIRTDPALSAQVIRMCNSPLFGRRSRVVSIEQATILLGADRLRSLAITSSLVGFAGQGLPKDQVGRFWKHGFFAAMLSKHLAKFTGYAEIEQAYIAGLLHDIGQVPQWMLVAEEKDKRREGPPDDWFDNPTVQRGYFGIDHCELGSHMAKLWDLMPSFVDVLLKHHEPAEAQHDPCLVQIVAGELNTTCSPKRNLRRGAGQRWAPESSPLVFRPLSGAASRLECPTGKSFWASSTMSTTGCCHSSRKL